MGMTILKERIHKNPKINYVLYAYYYIYRLTFRRARSNIAIF